jgi:uncharacterized protein (TIGR03083 family)
VGAESAVVDLLDVLVQETAQVDRLVRGADLAAPVAACPGWTVYELVTHLGAIHRWAAEATRTPPDELPPEPQEPSGLDGTALADWYAASAAELVEALSTDPEQACWTLAPPCTVGFWRRRQTHETVVHRWDLEKAMGRPARIDADVALDGIDEVLSVMLPRQVRLERVRRSSRWIRLRVDGQDRALALSTGRNLHPVATVAGEASSVLLLLWGRLTLNSVSVQGDREAADDFLRDALTP